MIDWPPLLITLGTALLVLLFLMHAIRCGWFSTRPTVRAARRRIERSLGLRFRDRRLLQKLSQTIHLEDRVSLILAQGCFEEAVRQMEPSEDQLAHIESIRKRMYG